MPFLTPADFLERLLSHHCGQIVACNLVDGLDETLFNKDFVHDLLDWWRHLFLWTVQRKYPKGVPISKEEGELMGSLNLLLFEKQDPAFRSGGAKPDFRFACRRNPRRAAEKSGFVNVTTAHRLIAHLMHEGERRRLAGSGLISVASEPTALEIAAVMGKGKKRRVRLRPDATVGRPRGVLWVTPCKMVEPHLSCAKPADRVRDLLGLIHYNLPSDALVVLHLPGDAIATGLQGRPTPADAGAHSRFRSRADSAANRKRSAWGHTVDLERFANGEQKMDGLPERVTEPISARRLQRGIAINPIGHIEETRGDQRGDDHEAFASRMCMRLGGLGMILQRLTKLL